MRIKLHCLIAAVFVLVFYIPAVQAQAHLTFSGGNGTPLSITLLQSVTYTINNTNCSSGTNGAGPIFVFDEAGRFLPVGDRPANGTISFSIDGGTTQLINRMGSGGTTPVLTPNDIYAFRSPLSSLSGSTVVLNAGTFSTASLVPGPPPANGSFTTFITNLGIRAVCSNNGVAAGTTAASVSISGRVLTNSRRGLGNALVYLTDREGNTRTARTTSLGYYRFNDTAAGQSVTITVVSKRYQFAPQVVNVNEEISGLNFLAEQ